MKFGFTLPHGDARTAAEFAHAAEETGWDGFFVWEPVWGVDAWVALTAAAMVTQRIRLGTMLTPLSRMRPWKLASETAALDNLSGGRVILAVGLGAIDSGFTAFGEVTDRQARADLLDEGLEILTRLWQGKPFAFQGRHYHIDLNPKSIPFPPPPPVQQPRIPIWVVGAWLREKSMRRALRYDGLLPAIMEANGKVRMGAPRPEEIAAIHQYVGDHHPAATTYDIILEGETRGDDPLSAAAIIEPYARAGATWWIESRWTAVDLAEVLTRIRQGPPQSH